MAVPSRADVWHDGHGMKSIVAILTFALSLSVAFEPAAAYAQEPSPEAIEQARRHYGEGVRQFEAERYPEALTSFQSAYALVERAGFLYNIHLCFERMGQLPEAIETLERYLAASPEDEERAALEQRLVDLERRLASMEASLRESASGEEPVEAGARDGRWGPPTLAALTLTGVGLGLGGMFLGLASGADAEIADDCAQTSSCSAEERDRAARFANVGYAGLVIGAGGLGLSLYYLLRDIEPGGTQVSGVVTRDRAEVQLRGEF